MVKRPRSLHNTDHSTLARVLEPQGVSGQNTVAYLREIFESSESNNGAGLTVNYCYREIRCLN